MNTTVVNIKHEPYDVYIGRRMPGLEQSPFANPFKVGRDGSLEEVLEKYRTHAKHLQATSREFAQALEGLRGRRIGCWCRPRRCHGDILLELLGEQALEPDEPMSSQGSLF